tara:strand:- start:180 stop:1004 length:825 start_codon:yes stop_codon:yes gene_type:complete
VKITKDALKRLIKEVIDDFDSLRKQAKSTDHAGVSTSFLPMLEDEESFQDMARAADEMFAADAKVVKRAVVRGPDGEEVELERTAGMSNEEWEDAKRVAMGGPPKKKLSRRQKRNKEQDRRYAIHKGRKESEKERASMFAKGGAPQLEQIVREETEAVLAEDEEMNAMVADEFARFANVPGYEDERVPGKTASQVRRRDLPPEEFKYDDSHLRDLGYLEEIIREETEAVLAEVDTKQDAPGLKGYSEREANRKASCKTWKAQGKSLPDWCDEYI